ncbi:MAG: hypothetical protein H6760_04680 [Candidatus Nomurabacteria bacterium]|nr:MAG: hypothetical protein H6760_04680 [Candidatus Nomurabacteria bacterium]
MPRRWFWWIALALVILTTFPYLYAWMMQADGMIFTGGHTLAPGDLPVYFSYIEQVKQGQVMLRDLFTAEPHDAFIFSPIWIVVGYMAKWLHLSALVSFHLARILLIPLLLWSSEIFLRNFLPAWRERKFAILLFLFAAGFGAIAYPFIKYIFGFIEWAIWPMDLWVSEAYTFLTMYQSPHFILATSLLILIFHWYYLGVQQKQIQYFLQSGLSLFLLMSFHPFHLPTVIGVFVLFILFTFLWQRDKTARALWGALLVGGLALPMIFYQVGIILFDPIANSRAAQNVNTMPFFFTTLISYGALIPLALLALFQLGRDRSTYAMPLAWLFGQACIFFLPISFSRRLTEGWMLPLALFAFIGLRIVFKRFPLVSWSRYVATPMLAVVVFSLSPIALVGMDVHLWTNDTFRQPPYHLYVDQSYQDMSDWMKTHTDTRAVFAAGKIGNLYIPAWAGRAVVFGHPIETLHYNDKSDGFIVARQSGNTALERWLREQSVDYLLWGEFDTRNSVADPSAISALQTVYQSGELTLYRLRPVE